MSGRLEGSDSDESEVETEPDHCDRIAAVSPNVLHDVAVAWGTVLQMSAQEQQRVAKAIAAAIAAGRAC